MSSSVVDDVVNMILQDVNDLPTGDYDEVLLSDDLLNVPKLDTFMEPETDVVEGEMIHALLDRSDMLGAYVPMVSPGQVILFPSKIRSFFWSLIREIHVSTPNLMKVDLKAGVRLVTLKTYYHEVFHFNCDVLRHLFNSSFDAIKEEALAVAYARLKIIEDRKVWQSQIGRMKGVVFNLIITEAFKYRSAGYRDWVLYSDELRFKSGLLEYVNPGNYQKLQSNGVNIEDELYMMLGKFSGYVEKVM